MAGRYSTRTLPLRATAANREKPAPRSRIIALLRRGLLLIWAGIAGWDRDLDGSRSLAQGGRITHRAQPGAVGAKRSYPSK